MKVVVLHGCSWAGGDFSARVTGLRQDVSVVAGAEDGGVTPAVVQNTWMVGLPHARLELVERPAVVLNVDNTIHPHASETIHERSAAVDKSIRCVDGDHFGMPLTAKPDSDGRPEIGRIRRMAARTLPRRLNIGEPA